MEAKCAITDKVETETKCYFVDRKWKDRIWGGERGEREDEKFETVIEKKPVNEILCDKKEQKKDFNGTKTVKIFLWDGNKQGISELENPIWRKIILSTFEFFTDFFFQLTSIEILHFHRIPLHK